MTHPNDMTQASRIVQDELDWLEEQDYTGLGGGERRNLFAIHLVMTLDTAGFGVGDRDRRPDGATPSRAGGSDA